MPTHAMSLTDITPPLCFVLIYTAANTVFTVKRAPASVREDVTLLRGAVCSSILCVTPSSEQHVTLVAEHERPKLRTSAASSQFSI